MKTRSEAILPKVNDRQLEVMRNDQEADRLETLMEHDKESLAFNTARLAADHDKLEAQPEVNKPLRTHKPKASAQLFKMAQDVRVCKE